MKFNLKIDLFDERVQKLIALSGQKAGEAAPLSKALTTLLLNGSMEERVSGDEKGRRFALLCKIGKAAEDSGIVDLDIGEIGILKPLIDANCPTVIHGRIMEILNAPIADA